MTDIEKLTDGQRTLRYAISCDWEIFCDLNEDPTPEDFLKEYESDDEWKEGYVGLLERAGGEDFATVFREVYDRLYANKKGGENDEA